MVAKTSATEPRKVNSDKNFESTKKNNNEGVTKKSARAGTLNREFDPGSGRTLAACLTHASRTRI